MIVSNLLEGVRGVTPLSVVVGVDTLPSKAAGLPNGTEVVAEKGKTKFLKYLT